MARYIPYDYNQNLMIVINFQDQLQPGTFEYALHYFGYPAAGFIDL